MLPQLTRATAIGAFVSLFALNALTSSTQASAPLADANDFNVFVLNDITHQNSNVAGRMAAGQNVMIQNYGIGTALPDSNGTRDDLIAGANLNFTNGQVNNGNIVFGQSANLIGVGVPNGTVRQQPGVIDFPAAGTQLHALSQQYAALSSNGTSVSGANGVTLTGSDPNLNVFDLTTAQLEAANSNTLTISVPAGSTALVNVAGPAASLHDTTFLDSDAARTLLNFDASNIQMQSLTVQASILAPSADITFTNGQLFGTFIASNLDGIGGVSFFHVPFTGTIPEPTSLTLLGAIAALMLGRKR